MVTSAPERLDIATQPAENNEAAEQVRGETRRQLRTLNTDIWGWLSTQIGTIGKTLQSWLGNVLGGFSSLKNTLGGFLPSLRMPGTDKPLEQRDQLAETGKFLERLPLDPKNILRPLNPRDFYAPRPGRLHKSIDIAAPSGSPVYAAFPAKVSNIVPVQRGVNSIVYLTDGSGQVTVKYIHLSRIDVKVGDQVTPNQVIGLSGGIPGAPGAGTSSGPHLHMEVIHKGQHVNPYAHLAGCTDCPARLKQA